MLLSDNGAAGGAGQAGAFQKLYSTYRGEGPAGRPGHRQDASAISAALGHGGEHALPSLKDLAVAGRGVPLIVSWPGKVRDPGAIRRQHVDVIDLAPTLAEAAGTAFARSVDGVEQILVAGASIMGTIASGGAPSPWPVQFFELRGDGAIRVDDWRAVAMRKCGSP